MVYGYVNRNKGETENFLNGIHVDEMHIMLAENQFVDTRKAFGKMVIGMWANLNKYDDECFGNPEQQNV